MIDPSQIDPLRLDANWRAITIELDAPRPSRLERLLASVRMPTPVVRMVAATPALRRSWYVSIVAVVLIGLGVADPTDQSSLLTLLVAAPLLPVLGVAMAYGSAADPSHEIQLATPTHGLRLVSIRAVTVVAVSAAVVVLLSLLNEAARPMAAAWLLPSLAVTAASLAMMTIRPPRQATSIVAVAWLGTVLAARIVADDPLAAFRMLGQSIALAVAVGAAVVASVRRDRFERLEPVS
jgi:hypothetical protein